jgi:NADPH:quinone reductase-like Zn-dependent oxidoreductase
MDAVYAARTSPDDPLSALETGERPEPQSPEGWTTVTVRAAALNHHDLWTLQGVGLRTEPPVVLGCDAAGVDEDGNEVVVHAVIGDPAAGGGDETLDPGMSILTEIYDGTFAERVTVPRGNLLPKPDSLSFAEAACLPVAWLTAYRMLFSKAGVRPGDRVLVQGAGGGVATAAILLGRAAGLEVYASSRSEEKRERARELGAAVALAPGERVPHRVDAVMETVGEATWSSSLKSLRPGGTVVVSGATSGAAPGADLARVFARQLRVVGSTMGTRGELEGLLRFCHATGVRPLIDQVLPMAEARTAFEAMAGGDLVGKIVLEP